MLTHINPKPGRVKVLELLTKIAQLIFEPESPLEQALEIVKQTASICEADISTLFVVEERKRLVLKAGVAYFRGKEMELPQTHFYELNWHAGSEEDASGHGLTAFVAASGKSLSIDSFDELMDKVEHPAHSGRWDKHIYPDGVDDPETGFGCMYAVPLRRSSKGETKHTVIGVFKIERRRNRPPFSEEDRKVFDLVAAHLSIILQTFHRVQNRVFSDVAHAIGGGLGRSYHALTTCEYILEQQNRDAIDRLAYLEKHLPGAVEIMERACKRLNLVLEASKDPDTVTDESLGGLWDSIKAEVELKAQVSLDDSRVIFDLKRPITKDTRFRLPSLQYHDLSSILGNLVDNAVRHGKSGVPVDVAIELQGQERDFELVFRVADQGRGVPTSVIDAVKHTNYTEVYRLPGTDSVTGTGLRRVFGLANHNHWQVGCKTTGGTAFELHTPDFRVTLEEKGES